jgi:hypothetical protein
MKDWIKRHKVLTGLIVLILLIVVAGAAGGGDKKTKQNNQTASTTQTPANQQNQPKTQTVKQPTVPKYELVGEYGQGGRVYVIAPSDASEEKLTLIGKDLNKKFGSDSFARIGIYTDKSQAQIMANNPLAAANLEGAAADAYDKAYVAQFNINKNTGLKQYTIMLNGQDKEITL